MNDDGFKNIYCVDYGNPEAIPKQAIISKADCVTITAGQNYCLKPKSLETIEAMLKEALDTEVIGAIFFSFNS